MCGVDRNDEDGLEVHGSLVRKTRLDPGVGVETLQPATEVIPTRESVC